MQRIIRRDAASGQGTQAGGQLRYEGLSARMCALLRARGITTEAEARAYLHPSLDQRHDPMLLHDMDKALGILRQAKKDGKRFIVYGDYDVDGICATAIMVQTLVQFGLKPPDYPTMYRIPDRHEEGYGLNEEAVRDLIGKTDLLITVDCGITSVKEVAIAREAGMQVIVTDHHALPDELPEADALIDPLMAPYPFRGLCGAGVAYQLSRALLGEAAAGDCLDLAALATVADMVPLRDENRAIVAYGLKAIEQTKRPGLQALIRTAGYRPPMRSEHIAFGLAPRMNACGRLKSALMAVRLLFEENEEQAELLAFEMNRLNNLRKEEERAVIEDAEEQLKRMDLCSLSAIVISGTGYDSGVVGLAAGRIAEKYGYPTVVLAEGEELAVGSARSVAGVDIYQALKTCSNLFLRFGGHTQAAGMTLRKADIPEFRQRLSDAVRLQIGPDGVLMPTCQFDDTLDLNEVNEETVRALELMEPFGMGNPTPAFYLEDVDLWSARAVGQNCEHLKCELVRDGVRRAGIAFRHGYLMGLQPKAVDILFTPTRNEFRGNVTYECQIARMLPRRVVISKNEVLEAAGMLKELAAAEKDAPCPADCRAYAGNPVPLQGTLVYCRCADTAAKWQDEHPELDVLQAGCSDPCAYSAVVYGVPLEQIRAPYKAVILADGLLTDVEHENVKAVFSGAQVYACPESEPLKDALSAFAVSLDSLRRLYSALRKTVPTAGVTTLASQTGLSVASVMAGIFILREIELVSFDEKTLEWSMKPMVRRSPEESPLYQLLHAGREETAWRTPLTNR